MSAALEDVMDVAELCRARDTLGYSDQVLAADLGLPPNVVTAWTSGRATVPKHIVRDLRWRVALIEQEKMITESGLAACEWVTAFEAQPTPEKLKEQAKRLEELTAHVKACPTCLAREAWVAEHCPPLPERQLPLWIKAVGQLVKFAERLPVWARPAVHVGAAFGAYSLLKLFFMLPQIVAHPRYALIALGGISLSISIGAVLGLLYGGTKHLWAQFKARRLA